MAELPQLSRVIPMAAREVWAHEAHHFTQWLLQNADVLSDVLGMDLELVEAERRVGNFSLDLIGTDLQTGTTVIIENQLEMTDHGHLGQLLTYAGGTDPSTIVWCAPRFRDEHRAALDWLNEHTEEGIRFFGVEIAAVRIEDSPPAPMFRLVVQPNDWTKRVHTETAAASNILSPRQTAYEIFWHGVLDRIRTSHPHWTSARAASRDNWITRRLTPDLGHADSSTMLGKRESKGWLGRTTRTSSGSARWTCMSPRRVRRSRASPGISGSLGVR